MRWAETTLTSWGMPSLSSISAVWLRVDQSDLEPMITPTSALIVVPLHLGRLAARQRCAPQGASKTNKPRGQASVACECSVGRVLPAEGRAVYRKAMAGGQLP